LYIHKHQTKGEKMIKALVIFALILASFVASASPCLLIVGDSLTADGRSYARQLARVYRTTIIAKIGHRTGWMLGRMRTTSLSGFTHFIVLGGANDIHHKQLRQASLNLLAMYRLAKSRGLKVIAITLPPSKGSSSWNPRKQAAKLALNRWILGLEGNEVDAVVHFYGLAGGKDDPERLAPIYDWRTDHAHPNIHCHRALAWAIMKKL
jgi:hypothetical protein